MKRKVRRSLAGALAFVMAFTLVSSDVLAAGSHAMNPTQAPETVITEEPQEVETLEETEILENTEKTLSVTGMGFYTGFDEGTLSAGWTSGNSNPSYAFEIVGACDEITPYSSGYCAYLDSDLFDNANASLVSPVLSLRECYDTMMLSFWYQNRPGEYGDVDRIGIYYRLGEGTWVNIASITNATQDWTHYVICVDGAGFEEVTYGIIVSNNLGGGVAIDDFSVGTQGVIDVQLDNSNHNGNLLLSDTFAYPETQVFVTEDLEEGCIVQDLCITGTTTGEQVELFDDDVEPKRHYFYMPYDNVVITGTVVQEQHLLDMAYENWEFGRAGFYTDYGFLNNAYVNTGDTLTIAVEPYEGCYATPVSAKDKWGNELTITQISANTYSFTMPDEDAVISVEFLQKPNTILSESFERESTYENWLYCDYDHDGYGWRMLFGGAGHFGLSAMCSNSCFESTGALHPIDWFYLPRFTVPENCMLSFWARESIVNEHGERIQIYVGDRSNTDDMFCIDEELLTEEYQRYVVDLSDYEGQEVDIAFAHMDVSNKGVAEVDDIVIYTETVDDDEVLIYEMDLRNGHPSTWEYYASQEFLATSEVDLTGAEKAYVTFYYKYDRRTNNGFGVYYRSARGNWQIIYADGEGTSGWESRTIELPVDALTDRVQFGFHLGEGISLNGVKVFTRKRIYTSLNEGFETGMSSAWKRINGENGLQWLTSSGPTTYGSAHGGRLDAQVTLNGSNDEAWLITPKLQLDRMGDYAVFSFWYYYTNRDCFDVWYRNASGDWNLLFSPEMRSSGWYKETIILSGNMLRPDTEIGFKASAKGFGSSYKVAIDDITLEAGKNPKPHVIRQTNQYMQGAHVEIDRDVAIPGEKVTIDITPVTTFSELFPFEVKTVIVTCGNQSIPVTEENAHRYSFSMPEGDVSVDVRIEQLNGMYFEDFSDAGTVYYEWMLQNDSTLSDRGTLIIASDEYVMTPALIVPENAGIRFWIKEGNFGQCTGNMAVYIGSSRDFTNMTKISPDYVANTEKTCYKIDLSDYAGQKVYFAFRHKACTYGALELDDVLLYYSGESGSAENDLGFENGYPIGWTFRDSPNGYGWFIGKGDNALSTGAPQGTHNMVAKSGHEDDETWMSGTFNLSNYTNVPKLSFWMIDRAKGSKYDKLQVYYRVEQGTSWKLAFETTEPVNEWTLQDVYFPKEAITWGFEVKFVATDCGGNGIGIDNITMVDADSFQVIIDKAIEHGSVTANPTSSNAGEYVTLQVTADEGYRLETLSATCNGEKVTIQKSNGIYYFQMPTGTVFVTATFVEKVVCTELHEDFNMGMPDGWRDSSSGGSYWKVGIGDNLEQAGAHSSRQNATFEFVAQYTGAYLVTPYLDLRGEEKALLHFWYLRRANNGQMDGLDIFYRVNDGSWMPICSVPGSEVWTDYYLELPESAMQENVELGFLSVSFGGNGVAIDDVTLIRSNNTYHKVDGVEIDGQGSVKPAQNYYQQGSTVDLYVTPFDVDLEIDTISATSSNQDVSLTKVDDCHYTFTMPADGVTVNATFKTKTSVRKVFVEDFESADSFAWTFAEPTAQIACWYLTGANDGMGHSQTTALYSCAPADANNVPYDHWAFTPAISVPESARLSFWLREADYTNELVDVYVGETGNMYDMTYLMTIEPMAYYQRYEIELDEYEGQNVFVAFRHHSEGNTLSALKEVYLDDVCVYTEAPLPKAPAKMRYAKAAFEGKLGVVYHMELPDWLVEDTGAYVRFYVAGKSYKKKLTNFTKNGAADDGTYRLAYYVPAAYYRETVTLRLYDGTGKLVQIIGNTGHDYTDEGVGYSLERYANTLMADSNPAVVELAVALENYCTATQIAFGYNSENLTLSSEVTDAVIENLDQYQSYGSTQLITGLAKKTLKASFDSDNSLKFGVVFAQGYGPEDFEYFIDGESAVLQGSQEDGYYLVVKNVAAAQLHVVHEFKIVRGNDVFVSNCSVLTYARAIIKTGTTEFQNLGKALILYNAAARNYFGVE